jgi:hydroxymethylpyrimidine/phosphomethylpyrimidine kinase
MADVRAFSALGLHGAAVVTAVGDTALGDAMVASQLEAVLSEIHVDAVKLTCPDDAQTLDAIADSLTRHDIQTLVLDPAGAPFDDAALAVLTARLLPLALVAVPNVFEAQSLASMVIDSWEDMRDAARAIAALGPANVVIKGGKRDGGRVTDLLFDGADYRDYTAERVELNVPGAGTTFDAALAATLAKGEIVQHAVAAAKAYVTKALQGTYDLGGVSGLHAFYRYWRPNAPER